MRPARWRRSTHVVVGVAVLLVVAAVVAVAAVVTSGGRSTSDATAIKPQPTPALAAPGVTPLADTAPKPTTDKLTAALAPFVADPNLGMFTGRITDAMTGAQLWAQGAGIPMQPASVNKLLTTAAALLTLDRDARLTTTVLDRSGHPRADHPQGWRGPDVVGGGTGHADLVPRRRTDQRPGRSGAQARGSPSPRFRSTPQPSAGRPWRRAGIRSTS